MSEQCKQKKIKVTVQLKKRLPCPQCGKGNMFEYYNYPSEDDVCSDCDLEELSISHNG